jgi:hypothetical protein
MDDNSKNDISKNDISKNNNSKNNNSKNNHIINTNNDSKKDVDEFTSKMDTYVKSISNGKYIFEVTKLCGYSEFVIINKDESLLDLYKSISHEFQCKDIKSLFIASGVNRVFIPMTDLISIRSFILDAQKDWVSRQFVIPVYSIPSPVVYRIYLDDGHEHI